MWEELFSFIEVTAMLILNWFVVGLVMLFACWPVNDKEPPAWWMVMWGVICLVASVGFWYWV